MELIELRKEDTREFKRLMQESFQLGYESVFGKCNEEVLPEKDIDECLDKPDSHAYELIGNDEILGGAIIEINENRRNELDFLFVNVNCQSRGIGKRIWEEIEKLYPDTEIWETCTPYFDRRNIHFYVNKLGFHIVEYYNERNPEPDMQDDNHFEREGGMFRFRKVMKYGKI
jgi:N-acetylglutamate synthase-like GNAT family acetyltransferase